jgi:hypothetical protein
MDVELLNLISNSMPQMNKSILNGLSVEHVKEAENYIRDVFRCASESFPPGLKFLEGRRCTPLEQFKEITRPPKPSRTFEMPRSDVYLMKYSFSLRGIELRPQYIYLPFLSDGGLMFLKGAQYRVTPVIGGKIFNIERGCIFMPIPRARLGFRQYGVTCIVNNEIIHSICVASYLYNSLRKTERSKLYPTLVHYVLAEYGLQNTIKLMFNFTAKVGEKELDDLRDNWSVYRSRQLPVSGRRTINDPVTEIRIAIPTNKRTPLVDSVMASIFYIIDNCVESTSIVEDLNNPKLWLQLLDKFIFKQSTTNKLQIEKMEEHMLSVRQMFDPITKNILLRDNIYCNNIFELFRYVCLNYQDIIIHHDVGTMYYNELSTLKYLMYNVVRNIFVATYLLQKLPEKLLTVEKVESILRGISINDKIFTVLGHGELTTVSIATDCKPYSATCNVISYNKAIAVGGSKHSGKERTDPALALHPSQAEVGTYQWITNKSPTGRDKLNPFVHFLERNYITDRPELAQDISSLRELLKRHR